jgi:hypothetical protein
MANHHAMVVVMLGAAHLHQAMMTVMVGMDHHRAMMANHNGFRHGRRRQAGREENGGNAESDLLHGVFP